MNNMLKLVREMHVKFGMTAKDVPFEPKEKNFRAVCLQEELNEYIEADTPADELDALIDLVVFAFGTAERQGFMPIFEEAFTRVMAANSAKIVGPNKKRGSFAVDLKKPEGWKPPVFDDLFERMNRRAAEKLAAGDSPVDGTLKARQSIYGPFHENARITQSLMGVLQSTASYSNLSASHTEAFHMIFHKIARVVCGDPNYADNVHDIAGYARCLEIDIVEGRTDA